MKKTTALLVSMVSCAAGYAVYAAGAVDDQATPPQSWPRELEPLWKQTRVLCTSIYELTIYEIPFSEREAFESSWQHILKVKSEGAPVVLLRGPLPGGPDAGVRIRCPPSFPRDGVNPPSPDPGATSMEGRWLWTTYIELIVDGKIVDLNRIPLPADTPIIDKRFEGRTNRPRERRAADEKHRSLPAR